MNDQTAQEPTMEEILASIRRIISEDDAPAQAEPDAVPEIAPEIVPVVEEEPEEEVLELTEPYQAPVAESIGDLDVAEVAPFPLTDMAEPEPEPVVKPVEAPSNNYDTLVGESAAASAASSFAGLAASFQKSEEVAVPRDLPFMSGNTVEDMVREMLRPMLKEWLDANLPGIVQDQVRKEVERIARSAG